MNPQPDTAAFSPKSGKELAKEDLAENKQKLGTKSGRASVGFGKSTAKFWEPKVFLPTWRDEHGLRRKVSNYFVRLMIGGRREAVALNTADRLEAARKASQLYANIRAVGWDAALREFDPERRRTPALMVTIGHAATAINKADMRSTTKANYVNALRWFGARHIGFQASKKTFGPKGSTAYRQEVDAVKLADLDQEAVEAIIGRQIGAGGGDANAGRSARISVVSFMRNARAALRIAERQGLILPEPRPFDGVRRPPGANAPAYTSIFDAAKLVRQAKKELSKDPPAYIAVLLALGAGLRRGEIQNLRWRRVDKERGRILIQATGGWSPKTGESEQPVHVSGGLLVELEQFRGKLDDFVSSPDALDRAVSWLRTKGLDGPKPLHQLRKEFGSLVAAESDLFTASKALRHSSLAVTAGVYVENRKRIAPDIAQMLNPQTKKRKL
ncbi:MAG: tyrosine-type recombinase/integrase [Verrucomicrobiota bacterium]|jgi:integrase